MATFQSLKAAPARGGRRSSKHVRTATRFCEEANIADADQLDLAEFIVAAHYLGVEADDEQLMDVFMDMESDQDAAEQPKQVIKNLMKTVEEKYGLGPVPQPESDEKDETVNEIFAAAPLDAFGEDIQWQDAQLGGFLTGSYEDGNLKIAERLIKTTALSREQIAQLTGVEAAKLEDIESDDEYESDYEEDEEPSKTVQFSVTTPKESAAAGGDVSNAAVVIQASEFSSHLAITNEDISKLDVIIAAGEAGLGEQSAVALELLKKLRTAVQLSPQGKKALKRVRTKTRLLEAELSGEDQKKLAEAAGKAIALSPKSSKKPAEATFPCKYRIVIFPGALVKAEKTLDSGEVARLPIGDVLTVEKIDGRRAKIIAPVQGWCSITSGDGRTILQKEGAKSEEMTKAMHAERARNTKIVILKSITTLNDPIVRRILEKSEWNLRRAIEAFFMAKYQTKKFVDKQENEPTNTDAPTESNAGDTAVASDAQTVAQKKSGIKFWKSWKTFAANN